MKRLLLLWVVFIGLRGMSQQITPALISLDFYKQQDTLGYNLVSAIPELLNKGIHDGSIPIWDSPKKEKKLSGKLIKQLEDANRTKFTNQHYLFFHELWSTTKRKTHFEILGMSFTGEAAKDSAKFNYGYIDIKDIMPLLKTSYIPLNLNGNYHTTYWEALQYRKYNFELKQLGHRTFTDLATASNNKQFFYTPKKRVYPKIKIKEQKYVAGYLNREVQNRYPAVDTLFKKIERHYAQHKIEFLQGVKNLYPEFDTTFIPPLTAIEYGGVWRREGNNILTSPDYVLFYFGDLVLDTLTMAQIGKWPHPQGVKGERALIKNTKFEIIITRINETVIPKESSDRFMQALRFSAWNKLSYFWE